MPLFLIGRQHFAAPIDDAAAVRAAYGRSPCYRQSFLCSLGTSHRAASWWALAISGIEGGTLCGSLPGLLRQSRS